MLRFKSEKIQVFLEVLLVMFFQPIMETSSHVSCYIVLVNDYICQNCHVLILCDRQGVKFPLYKGFKTTCSFASVKKK